MKTKDSALLAAYRAQQAGILTMTRRLVKLEERTMATRNHSR